MNMILLEDVDETGCHAGQHISLLCAVYISVQNQFYANKT